MTQALLPMFLSMAGLTAFMHSLKWAQNHNARIYSVAFINYIAAAAIFLIWVLAVGLPVRFDSAIHGAAIGCFYGLTFFLITYGIEKIGVGRSSVIVNLSQAIPILVSVMIWDEKPASLAVAGIILGLFSIPMILWPNAKDNIKVDKKTVLLMALLFVSQGLAYTVFKSFERLGRPEQRPGMLAALFGAASIITFVVLLVGKQKPSAKELLNGLVTGTFNAVSNAGLATALGMLAATVVFPTVTAGSIILTTVTGILLWSEKYSLRSWLGIGLAITAVVLINL